MQVNFFTLKGQDTMGLHEKLFCIHNNNETSCVPISFYAKIIKTKSPGKCKIDLFYKNPIQLSYWTVQTGHSTTFDSTEDCDREFEKILDMFGPNVD